jgi:hypothetical protein
MDAEVVAMESTGLVVLLLGLCLVLGGLVEYVVCEHARSARDRRQADTQRHLNAASAALRRQVHELDVLIEDVRRRSRTERDGQPPH